MCFTNLFKETVMLSSSVLSMCSRMRFFYLSCDTSAYKQSKQSLNCAHLKAELTQKALKSLKNEENFDMFWS